MTEDKELRDVIAKLCEEYDIYSDSVPGAIQFFADDLIKAINQLRTRDRVETQQEAKMYMTPDQAQDYQNRLDGTFQNDPRLNRKLKASLEQTSSPKGKEVGSLDDVPRY